MIDAPRENYGAGFKGRFAAHLKKVRRRKIIVVSALLAVYVVASEFLLNLLGLERQRLALGVLLVAGGSILLYGLASAIAYYRLKAAATHFPTDVANDDVIELHEAYLYGTGDQRRDVCDGMTHLLLTDNSYDAELTPGDLTSLLSLTPKVTGPLALAILSIIEREGNENHLKLLNSIARNRRRPLVEEKAKSCIDTIQKRQEIGIPAYAVVRTFESDIASIVSPEIKRSDK